MLKKITTLILFIFFSQGNIILANQLSNETSPYLLQHKDNPVNWYPWQEKAFEKAKKTTNLYFYPLDIVPVTGVM